MGNNFSDFYDTIDDDDTGDGLDAANSSSNQLDPEYVE